MSNLKIYIEDRQSLGEISFVSGVPKHVRIREADSHEVSKSIGHWFAAITNSLGIKEEMNSINRLDVTEMILSKFKSLSVDELYYAFKMERYGNLLPRSEHYQLFNAKYVSEVLDKYILWKRKIRVDNDLAIGKLPEAQQVTDEEKKELIMNGVLRCFDHYKEHYLIAHGKTYVYDVLYDIDLLPKDKESKDRAYADAKLTIAANLKGKKANISIKEKDEHRRIMRELELKRSDYVIVHAKHIMIGEYFRKVKRAQLIEILKLKL